ncbi:inclusion membrane protein IncB [Candidatus Chlamydia sanziniae]|uniref:Inclusion Membrane Protein B n=1 Tax=Candidatus Chlamydia sanziniae TaxID=1806891 RepID=A0A1A9HY68_9CHLA|nr:inclusion membrane protein IncB [Candidatus Chlamydia sanziniae]ANH79033.1 Inclusion Membrane Protein B [Candidatus Chlamydia sanziniae]
MTASIETQMRNLDDRLEEVEHQVSKLDPLSQTVQVLSLQVQEVVDSSIEGKVSSNKVGQLQEQVGLLLHLILEDNKNKDPAPQQFHVSSTSGYKIQQKAPSTLAKVLAVLLTLIALIALTVLIVCILTACGACPIVLSILNLYTIGACISLPVLGSLAVGLMVLSILGAQTAMKNKLIIINSSSQSS